MRRSRIRERREAMGLSQVQLAVLSGLANSAISDFELSKRTPWPKARRALARALKTTVGDLFPGEEHAHEV